MTRIRLAYSPDADDAFMFYGIACGAVPLRGLELVPGTDDIEVLNQRAESDDPLDVSAISYAAWPLIADRFDLLPVGSSFGLGYGPRVISRSPMSLHELGGRTVAIPGERTTAALLLALAAPRALCRTMRFDEIAGAVLRGEVDAGVVIHEGQLTHEGMGLSLVQDLGAWWHHETGGLPVPLGANAIRRGLPDGVVTDVIAVLHASIEHALAHREDAVRHALPASRGLSAEMTSKYVGMYVNELSLDPGPEGRAAVEDLYSRASRAGLLPRVTARWAS